MTMPALGKIEIVRGQALDIEVTVPDEADPASGTIEFGISEGPTQPYLFVLPTTINGQKVTGDLTDANSLIMTKRQYYYSAWLIISGDPTPIARGYIDVSNDSRNR